MYTDDELIPLSALQHLLFCERQCALIHQEQVWADNRLTVEGTRLHQRADSGQDEMRRDLVFVRGLPVRSTRLGLSGRADVVEFRRVGRGSGVALDGREGRWAPAPVEYKRGRPKRHRADEVQLCAQALCLEEMFEVCVSSGGLFYGAKRRRSEVVFNDELRRTTETASARLHSLLSRAAPPAAEYQPRKCDACSLISVCLPRAPSDTKAYLRRSLAKLPSGRAEAQEPGRSVVRIAPGVT
ncbi:CRISPR-associated protein Cas4 [Candidatus Palauibacter sp.]|uniref:CRISPR-associated protein Cas4 n=1 Tax=Candidatus Palauibacter sp. TaxID=3101350 RepID=UPI003B523496